MTSVEHFFNSFWNTIATFTLILLYHNSPARSCYKMLMSLTFFKFFPCHVLHAQSNGVIVIAIIGMFVSIIVVLIFIFLNFILSWLFFNIQNITKMSQSGKGELARRLEWVVVGGLSWCHGVVALLYHYLMPPLFFMVLPTIFFILIILKLCSIYLSIIFYLKNVSCSFFEILCQVCLQTLIYQHLEVRTTSSILFQKKLLGFS